MTRAETERMTMAASVDRDLAKFRDVKPITLNSKCGNFNFHVYDFMKDENKIVVHVSEKPRMGIGGELVQRQVYSTLSELLGTAVGAALS